MPCVKNHGQLAPRKEALLRVREEPTDLDDASEANGASHGCRDKICGGETAEKTDGVDGPWIEGPLPLTLRVPAKGAPEGEELDGKDRVEKGSYGGCGQNHGPVPAGHDRGKRGERKER